MLVKIGDCFVEPSEIAMVVDSYDSHVEVKPMICIHLRCGSSHWIHSTMDEAEAALIDAGVMEEPVYDEVPELTDEEDAKAQALFDAGYKYLARDEDGKLFAYKFEPVENQGFYMPGSPAETAERIDRFFDFISPGGCCPIAGLLLPY